MQQKISFIKASIYTRLYLCTDSVNYVDISLRISGMRNSNTSKSSPKISNKEIRRSKEPSLCLWLRCFQDSPGAVRAPGCHFCPQSVLLLPAPCGAEGSWERSVRPWETGTADERTGLRVSVESHCVMVKLSTFLQRALLFYLHESFFFFNNKISSPTVWGMLGARRLSRMLPIMTVSIGYPVRRSTLQGLRH